MSDAQVQELIDHAERAHSRFSASGSERWLNCAYSVGAEELAPPSLGNFWSKEGTLAHEVLEALFNGGPLPDSFDVTAEMIHYCEKVVAKVKGIHKAFGGKIFIEKRVWATFIHPDMFGTCDIFIVDAQGTLHIIDFKYGVSPVRAERNTQLIQYALSVAESYNWEFDNIKMWIMQPRVGKTNWFNSWEITCKELQTYWLPLWEKGVARVEKGKGLKPFAGSWCHWCRAAPSCPAKQANRVQKVVSVFESVPLTNGEENHGFKKEGREKSKTGRKEKVGQKANKEKSRRQKGKANPFA